MAKKAARPEVGTERTAAARKLAGAPDATLLPGVWSLGAPGVVADMGHARHTEQSRKGIERDPRPGVATGTSDADDLSDQLTAGFKSAVEAAIQEAFGAGLAVPGRENGKPVERRPDGKVVEIRDPANWTPDGWKSRP